MVGDGAVPDGADPDGVGTDPVGDLEIPGHLVPGEILSTDPGASAMPMLWDSMTDSTAEDYGTVLV